MTNFLRKFVKSKSRSKSPSKQHQSQATTTPLSQQKNPYSAQYYPLSGGGISYDYDDWTRLTSERQPAGYSPPLGPHKRYDDVNTFDNVELNHHRRRDEDADEYAPTSPYLPTPLRYSAENTARRRDFGGTGKSGSSHQIQQQHHGARPSSSRDLKMMSPGNQQQHYFTPTHGHKSLPPLIYDDVAAEKKMEPSPFWSSVPHSPQLNHHHPHNRHHSPVPSTNFFDLSDPIKASEPRPGSSYNTLSPAWQSGKNRHPAHHTSSARHHPHTPTLFGTRPTHSECMNGGVVGGGGAAWNRRISPSVPGSVANLYAATTEFGAALEPNGYVTTGDGVAFERAVSPAFSSQIPLRLRSASPRKPMKMDSLDERKHRSRSPTKRSSMSITKTIDYLQSQCKMEGCSAAVIVESTRFLVCKHQLSHASDFFRTLFLNNRALPIDGVKQTSLNEYTIVVSGLKHPPQSVQFQWFIECTIPCPILKSISDNSLETCMRLSRRFAAKGLEFRCAKFIQDNVEDKPPMMALCWLNWVFKHRFDRATHDACLPVVARLPLHEIERHRQMLPEKLVADLIAMKLRTCYQQAAKVFYTIHKMDHFHVEMDKCPRCGRHRDQGKIRIHANPCQKLVGCERCMSDFGCEIERKSSGDYEAFHQCDHGLWPFNDQTEDCRCQTPIYRANTRAAYGAQIVESSRRETPHPSTAAAAASGGKAATLVPSQPLPSEHHSN